MEIEYFELPSHWVSAFVLGDNSGYDADDIKQIDAFTQWMVNEYGQCWCLDVEEEYGFSRYHDATRFGALACDVSTFAFDVTKRTAS